MHNERNEPRARSRRQGSVACISAAPLLSWPGSGVLRIKRGPSGSVSVCVAPEVALAGESGHQWTRGLLPSGSPTTLDQLPPVKEGQLDSVSRRKGL